MDTKMVVDHGLLKMALSGNAAFSGVSGLLLLFATDWVGSILGNVPELLLWIIGGGLLLFATDLVYRVRTSMTVGRVLYFIVNDLLWVLGSIALIIVRPDALSSTGLWVVAGVACVVAVFSLAQGLGLKSSLEIEPVS